MYLIDKTVKRYPGLTSPSRFLGLPSYLREQGYPEDTAECAAFDFDMTVGMVGEWADNRAEEVEYVSGGSRPPKNAKPVRKYQGYETLLALDFIDEEQDGEPTLSKEDATALLRNPEKLREELQRMLRGE